MLKEIEMQGYMQRLRGCRGQDRNARRMYKKERLQRIGWEEMLCKVGASLLIVLLEIACIDRL